jgi:hypothetical protein
MSQAPREGAARIDLALRSIECAGRTRSALVNPPGAGDDLVEAVGEVDEPA